ncbi:MAG: hypothetical protein LBG44_04365 [Gemmatimonadota bacterium]|jgi:hypothetical protein|nr:hypothetical protein [Gemmatimonadota bacterium]
MHVYLKEDEVRLRMEQVDGEGLVPDDSDLLPMAFFAEENLRPSFRAFLSRETVNALQEMLNIPVLLGVLAEEPEQESDEVHAMVGLAVPVDRQQLAEQLNGEEEEDTEPWRDGSGSDDAWRGDDEPGDPESDPPATALFTFAPLVRLKRVHPENFAEELADLLESALAGSTRPANEARVDRFLEGL